jgi:transcription antitermination protein NusB
VPAVARHQARERALSLLYEAEIKGLSPSEVLDGLPLPPDEYAASLVRRVEDCREEADELIGSAAIGWPVERLAVIDRLILRVAVAELLDPRGPPVAVIIDEAVELAKAYSTEESGGFVNGVLSTLSSRLR